MSALQSILETYGLDPRSFVAGALWGMLFCVGAMAIVLGVHWFVETTK